MELDRVLAAQRAWQAVSSDDIAASKFALESLTRCADAIAVLSNNLHEIGYHWANTEPISPAALQRNIAAIEKTIGLPAPKIIAVFWEKIGGVSFVDLKKYRHVDFWEKHKIRGREGFCEGLYVDPCNEGWASFICDDFLDWQECCSDDEDGRFLLSLSPDGYHKDNISGGESYGVYPGASWKPTWENFEWPGVRRPVSAFADPPDFLSYLRTTILEGAGFPGFLGTPAFDPVKERLLQGVPIF
ncbi:MAG TPA: hypothetical protein VK897_25745 [Anaerolineales bacterium]|nr:hypothetical protein [Anaerolineales bacterium]